MIIAGATAGPVWNSLMKDIVKENQGEYFGKRSRITGFIGILSMIIAGIILNFFEKDNFFGFFIILLIACIGRLCSGYMFTKQYEPELKLKESYYFSPLQFVKKMSSNNFGRFVILVTGISFATAIAAPFFAVYMLRDLNFSYIEFTIVTLSSPLATLIFVPFWGKFADKYGNLKVLKITGYLIPLIPAYWLGTLLIIPYNSIILLVAYLFIFEILSGFAWAGFNLCSVNFIYDAVTRERIALCATYYNILTAFGTLIGGLLGGILASQSQIFGIKSILFVFFLSGILRFFLFVITVKEVKEVRSIEDFGINHQLRKRIKHYLGIETQEIIEVKD
jgi:MFS family permease